MDHLTGWGITNADKSITGTTIRRGLTISRATAEKWLRESLDKKYGPKVMKYDNVYHWNQNQYDALVSFAFNIGSIDQLTANGTRSLETVKKKILEYDKAGGRRLKGLTRRREAEYALFCTPVITVNKLISSLETYHEYIKKHYKSFINLYDSDIKTFSTAKAHIAKGKTVGITCVVPLRWALAEMGIKQSNGKSLISAPNGTFEKYYTGDVKKYFDRLTKGGCNGKTITQAIDHGLLKKGDIVCFENLTHTFVYSGNGYMFYEGGGACVKSSHYPDGILLDYRKPYGSRKIAEVLRMKGQSVKSNPKEGYDMPTIKNGSKGKAVKWWQIVLDVTVDGDFGDKTEAATKKFQKNHGLKDDGIVGSFTWSAGIGTL